MAAQAKYVVTGIQCGIGPDGRIPERMELDALWSSDEKIHDDQMSLYIWALIKMQKTPITDRLSWFQLAGLHSEPRQPWDGDYEQGQHIEARCAHGKNLFPTWHRPYLLLMEQRLFELMKEVIKEFPAADQPSLLHAAETWRLPYWDWGAKRPTFETPDDYNYDAPHVARLETVHIRSPPDPKTGKCRRWVKNPLYSYVLPGGITFGEAGVQFKDWYWWDKDQPKTNGPAVDFSLTKSTSRHAPGVVIEDGSKEDQTKWGYKTPTQFIEGTQHCNGIAAYLRDMNLASGGNVNTPLRENVYRILNVKDYESFSCVKAVPDAPPDFWTSIEGIHNLLHNWVGGMTDQKDTNGHMSHVAIAAFDPLFWLHHCNIDRLFAIWQQLHPKEASKLHWFTNSADAATPLKPFRKNAKGDFYTPDDVYDTTALGYTYTDLPKSRKNGKVQLLISQGQFIKNINTLYNSTARAQQKCKFTPTAKEPGCFTKVSTVGALTKKLQCPTEKKAQAVDITSVEDYIALIKFKRFALNGRPFTVQLFIGPVPDPKIVSCSTDFTTLVGEAYNFVSPWRNSGTGSGCKNCQDQAEIGLEVSTSIVLTNSLITRWKQQIKHEGGAAGTEFLKSMKEADVVPFLKEHLHWRILGGDGTFIDRADMKSLAVGVACGKSNHYADETKLSEYKDYKVLYNVTNGRECGATPSDPYFPGSA